MVDDTRTEWSGGWGCGSGSSMQATELFRPWLVKLAREFNITTVADVGCGKEYWQRKIHWRVKRDGYDIRYKDPPFNAITDVLPKAYDMIMCIYVTNHFTKREYIQRAIQNFKDSQSTYLLLTYAEGPPDCEPWDCPIEAESLTKFLANENEKWNWYHGFWKLSEI